MRDNVSIGDRAWLRLEFGCPLPIAALYSVARLARSAGIETGETLVTLGCQHLVDDRPSLFVLPELQMGIDQIIHSMHPIVAFLVGFRCLHGCDVGRDRLLPITDPREDVRRH